MAKKKIKNKKNFKFPKDKIIDFFKKLSLKNYLNIVVVLLLIISSTYIFFQYKMIIFPDSIGYYHNAYIIMGIKNLSEWLTVRGFGFPLIITFWIKLFGDTSLGMLIGSYTAYLTMIIIIGYLIQKYIKLNEINNKLLYFFLYIIIIVFNPLIIGYNHTLLTEAVMPAIYFAEVLLCLKWYESTLRQNKKSIIILNIIFILLGILIWFIKQPFIVAYIVGLLITAICSAIKNKSWKILAQKLLTILICLVTLFICLKIWNSFISNNISTQNSPSDLNNKYLNNKFISGLNVFYYGVSKDTFCNTNYIEKADFSNKEKEKIYLLIEEESENWCSYIKVFEIKELNGAHVATEILYSNNGNFNLESRLSFLVKNVIKHPTYVLRSYLYNYLAIADIQTTDYTRGYASTGVIDSNVVGENLSNGMHTFYNDRTTTINNDSLIEKFYDTTATKNENLTQLLFINNSLCFYLYKLLVVLALPIFIYSLIKYIKYKNSTYFIILLTSVMCFSNAIFNVFFAGIIDRYVYPTYTLMLLCLIILFMEKRINEKVK